jgi:hypothetical protein
MLNQALTVTALAASVHAAVPYASLPLHLYHGPGHKIATDLVDPHSNRSVEVVVDQGSENFWVFGPDSTNNWGCTALMCQGPCNVTVQPFYDYPNSPTASKPEPFQSFYSYGGNTKIIQGEVAVNDTLLFVSDAGVSSTIDTRVAISYYMQQRLGKMNNECVPAPYDHGILGTGPFLRTPEWNTTGPHVRQNLLESGVIDAPVQSMWFDELPEHIDGIFTGNTVFGAIDHSKYSGDLVTMKTTKAPSGPTVGYWVEAPVVKVNNITMDKKDMNSQSCLIDSGTTVDDLPISPSDAEKFAKATGLSRSETGVLGWNGTCESIPRDITIDFEFTGIDDKTVTVKVPLRTYSRKGISAFSGMCEIMLDTGSCLLGAGFSTAAFFAADDAAGTVAFAQGGVSKRGSAPDADSMTIDL